MIPSKKSFLAANYDSIIKEIDKIISEGSASSEIWGQLGYYLKHLDQIDMNAYKVVRNEIEELDNYLWSIGLKLS